MTSPQTLSVTLPDWEGPLDLLLHVIRTHKLDILNIPIAFVTEQYLSYLDSMRDLNLDIAAEYLEMAATLVHIKSRTMLPTPPEEEEEEAPQEEGDPREELIRRLLEYQRYKDAAQRLGDQPLLGRDTFVRGPVDPFPGEGEPEDEVLIELGLFDLADAFRTILERTKSGLTHDVTFERMTIAERIGEIASLLPHGLLTPFYKLFSGYPSRFDVVLTLLALLEMTRLRMTRLYQSRIGSQLYVKFGTAAPGPRASHRVGRVRGRGWKDRCRISRTRPGRIPRRLPRTLLLLRRPSQISPRILRRTGSGTTSRQTRPRSRR
jgi:segregation and condensation protein A